MSEEKENKDLEKEKNETLDEKDEKIEAEPKTDELPSRTKENIGNYSSGALETGSEGKIYEKVDADTRLVVELKEDLEIPSNTDLEANGSEKNEESNLKNDQEKFELSRENLENGDGSDKNEQCDKDNSECRLSNEKLENGDRLVDAEEKRYEQDEDETKGGDYTKESEDQAQPFRWDPLLLEDEDGTEEDQAAFMRDLENFHKEMNLEFKAPKFYGEGLNCLKLWRAVTRLGGYDQVTSCKLWRQVGESFNPPKTCTTISWSFRIFYEKALLEFEKHKILTGELNIPISSLPEPLVFNQIGGNQTPGLGRARRDAAARAMQAWHPRLHGNGEVGEPIIKDRTLASLPKQDKYHKGGMKRKTPLGLEQAFKVSHKRAFKSPGEAMVVDVGETADWVKINVKRTKDCFEVYALVPGLLREEVHVQSDPAGRLIISGDPEQPDNPWGVTPFKKVVTLPARIDPHQTSAVVTLHGQLFVRVPFEQPDL